MKRGYLWVDWVELGCRGWDISTSGAATYFTEVCHPDCYAHLDRTTLNLLMFGCRQFHTQVTKDLLAAGIFKVFIDGQPVTGKWVS